ncbi:GNAT family N-acetyltransferase [Dyella sp.]|uniref:GNAT family N-acetyltransferase n=1 Tax=Dyella sp. TaxID=1869338 RepID=UPI002FD9F15A
MLIRPARPDDALRVAHVHVRAWQAGYRHLLPGDYLARLDPRERAQHYDFANQDMQRPKTLVVEEDGTIHGFATTAPARDADTPDGGELCALYVDPDVWGRGFGTALLSAARLRLAERGYRHAVLWLLAGNQRAERLYRADGWALDGQTRTESIWDVTVDEVRYRRPLLA